jgi:hypothetical protein
MHGVEARGGEAALLTAGDRGVVEHDAAPVRFFRLWCV